MQSGFHIPVQEGPQMSVFDKVFADIGDDQSLENSLSTFSSHVKNLASIINQTHKATLLLFDEIGSGTEPGELIKVHEKQVKIVLRAKDLYPEGYDLETLFISFKERKLDRDIERGSKKALKQIRKHGIESLRG